MAKVIGVLLALIPATALASHTSRPDSIVCDGLDVTLPVDAGLVRTDDIRVRLRNGYIEERRSDGSTRIFYPTPAGWCTAIVNPPPAP